MLTILIIFDSSFVLRFVSSELIAHWSNAENKYSMALTIQSLITPQLCDLVPICCVFFIHMQNFKVIQQECFASDTSSQN